MTIDSKDRAKLDPMADAFMKFFEDNYNVKFVDAGVDEQCKCNACLERHKNDEPGHLSDCAVHNEPAMPNGECDCY